MTDTANERIKSSIEANDVFLFMKGTPSFPQCGFSAQVTAILQHLDVPFESLNVLEDDDVREGVKAFSDWPTIPQLYVKGEFVGGCDIVTEMFENGELREYLDGKGVTHA